MHDVIIVGIPLLAMFTGILLNRSDVKEIRAGIAALGNELRTEIGSVRYEMNRRFDALDARFDAVDAELRYCHGVTGKLEGRIESLEKR